MEQVSLHRGLELRLEALAARIRMLREKTDRTGGVEKLDGHRQIDELEQRQKSLETRLDELRSEDPTASHGLTDEVEKLSYDLSGAVDNVILWVDSGYRPEKKPDKTR